MKKEEYLSEVKGAVDFLSGNDDEAQKLLKSKMLALAECEEFERALEVKEQLNRLEKIKEKKITALNRYVSADFISVKSDGIFSAISVLFVRSGKSMGVKNYFAENFVGDKEEILSEFLLRFYDENREIPGEIYLPYHQEDIVIDKIRELSGKKTMIAVPEKGVKKELLLMAEKNASDYLNTYIDKIAKKNELKKLTLTRLKELLKLRKNK